MTLGQFPASPQARPGPEPLDNASLQPNKPHRIENQARDDQKDQPQPYQKDRDKSEPDERQETAQDDVQRLGRPDRPAAYVLKRRVNDDRLAERGEHDQRA